MHASKKLGCQCMLCFGDSHYYLFCPSLGINELLSRNNSGPLMRRTLCLAGPLPATSDCNLSYQYNHAVKLISNGGLIKIQIKHESLPYLCEFEIMNTGT